MWDWLQQQAQSASPFIATFCLIIAALATKIAHYIWKQLLAERSEHRISEKEMSIAMRETAVSLEKLAAAQGQVSDTINTIMPILVDLSSERTHRK